MVKFDITDYLIYNGVGGERRKAKKASNLNEKINDTVDTIIDHKGKDKDIDELIDLYIKELLDIYRAKNRTVKEIRTFQLGWDDWAYRFLNPDVFITLLDNLEVKEEDSDILQDYKTNYKKNTILPYFEDNFMKSPEEAEKLQLFFSDYFENPADKRFRYMTKAKQGPKGLEMSIDSYEKDVRRMSLSKEEKWREDYKYELKSLQKALTDITDKIRRYGDQLKYTEKEVNAIYNEANWNRLTEEEAQEQSEKLWKKIDKTNKNIKDLSSLLDKSKNIFDQAKSLENKPFDEEKSYDLLNTLVSDRMDVVWDNRSIYGKNLPLIG